MSVLNKNKAMLKRVGVYFLQQTYTNKNANFNKKTNLIIIRKIFMVYHFTFFSTYKHEIYEKRIKYNNDNKKKQPKCLMTLYCNVCFVNMKISFG